MGAGLSTYIAIRNFKKKPRIKVELSDVPLICDRGLFFDTLYIAKVQGTVVLA